MRNQVFKVCLVVLSYVSLFISTACKKTYTPPSAPSATAHFYEYKTNKPIKGALVHLYHINHLILGNSLTLLNAYGYTDAAGNFSYNPTGVDIVTASHPNYWAGAYFLIPQATVKLHLRRTGHYPNNSWLTVNTTTTENFSPPFGDYLLAEQAGLSYWEGSTFCNYTLPIDTGTKKYYLPTDTIVYLPILGYCNNYIRWDVRPAKLNNFLGSGSTSPFYVNPFDTVKVEVDF